MFVQWVNAGRSRDKELADFYRDRFRPEYRPEYRLASTADAERLDRAAEASSAMVATNIQRATNYVLGVVLFAGALFFAGISAKLQTPALRKALLVLGGLLFTATAAWIATFPVSVSI
jgi:hypothetical protein